MNKRFHWTYLSRGVCYGVCGLALLLLMTACSVWGFQGIGSTPTPTPTPKPTPTTAPAAPASPLPGTLTQYKGNGYTIGYPNGWTVKTESNGITRFSEPNGLAYFAITSQPNPQGVVSSSQMVDVGLQLFKSQSKDYARVNDAPSTASVAGETWSSGSATGDVTQSGQSTAVEAKVIVLADNHPANSLSTMGYTIAYGTGQQVFDLANTTYFQPMLASFHFA